METGSGDKSDISNVKNILCRRNCEVCNMYNIHIKDWENHESSRHHQSKFRAKNKKPSESKDDSYYIICSPCNRKFTDETFYNIHLGTKTHKRNLRKFGEKDTSKHDAVTPMVATTIAKRGRRLFIPEEEAPVKESYFIRKKYKIRNLKTDDLTFRSYIYSLTAYLSLRLTLNQQVQNFMISVNDKDWGPFGDIVVNMVHKDKNIIYAIQCKKVNQSFRQISCLEEAKVHLEKQFDCLAELKRSGKDFTETRFAIFTTYNTSSTFSKSVNVSANVLNKWKTKNDNDISQDTTMKLKPLTKKNDIINVTSDPENVYSLLLTDKIECDLPYLFFYTSQRINPSMLNDILKLRFDNYPNISKDYIKYIENWGDGKLGGNYKLNKKDVVLKLGEILLSPYIVSPKKIESQHDTFGIWNCIIDKVDLTVVKNEPFIMSKICQPLNKIIEETLETNIDTITRSINLKTDKGSILDYIQHPIKSYFFEVIQNQIRDEIPLSLIYNVFWKVGKIPLLLSSENQEECKGFILEVILFMKQMGVNKKFLLKSAELNLTHFKEQLNIFSCLEDIKHLVNLEDIKIRVSDTFSLSLNTINSTDPFFFKGVTPNVFFDLSLGRYSLKPGYNRKFRERDELKIILSDEVKEQLEVNLYPHTDLLRMNSSSHVNEKLRGIDPCLF